MNIIKRITDWFKKPSKDDTDKTLDELLAHVTDARLREDIYKPIIENQLNYLNASVSSLTKCPECGTSVPKRERWQEVLPELSVKILDKLLILKDIVAFQPMKGPVDLVYKLRYSHIEEVPNGRNLSLEIISEAVEAASSKLAANWTIEAAQDVFDQHNKDLEQEILDIMATEIAGEMIAKVIADLTALGSKHDFSELAPKRYDTAIQINYAANEIARRTRRGAGNYVILSSRVAQELETNKEFVKDSEIDRSSILYQVGTLNKNIHVYVYRDGDPDMFVVGYKGGNGNTDAGYYLCPYILLMSTGIVVDPLTFQPLIGFVTRNGVNTDDKSPDYFATIVQTPA